MKNYPARLAVFYLMIAGLWIFVSDWLADELVPAKYITVVQSIKGFLFVIITAIGLYLILRYYYRRIRKKESEYRQLFNDNPHPMWVYDMETLRFLTVNNAATQRYKYTTAEFAEMRITDIRPDEDQDSILMFVEQVRHKTFHDAGIWRHKDKNGRKFFVKITSHSTTFGDKKARLVLAIDVDEQIENQVKIRNQIAQLKEVAWMQSHEVRKPVANILGLLNLLKNSKGNAEENIELINHMETAGQELDQVIKKIVEKSSVSIADSEI